MPDFSKNKFTSPLRGGLKPTATDSLLMAEKNKLTQSPPTKINHPRLGV